MNLRPRKHAELAGMLRHDFRRYGPETLPAHIDPERQALNRTLWGEDTALDSLPTHQPDTGRKIRKDANVVASLVCTLPKELAPDDTAAVDAWATATLDWLRKQCPGQLAYAVLHQDESRPHIHAAVIPADDRGHLSYKEFFSGKDKLRILQKTYAQALAPLGVTSNSALVKAVRRTQYTRGIHGWRVPGLVHALDTRERALESDLRERTAHDTILGQLPPVRPRDLGSAQRYRRRVESTVLRTMQAREAKGLAVRRETNRELHQSQAQVSRLERQVRRQAAEHARYREAVEQVLTPQQRERIATRDRTPDREHDLGL